MTAHSDSLPGLFRPGKSTEENSHVSVDQKNAGSHSTTGGDLDQEPVVVWEAANRMEAQIVQGRLESEGIPTVIHGEALGAIYGLTTGGLAMSKVLVPAPLAKKALEILSSEDGWGDPE